MDKDDIQDRYLFSVGVIVQQATSTEAMLCWVLEKLAGISKELAEAIFYTFDAFPTRRQLLLRVLATLKADQETKDLVDVIIRNVEKCSNKRNEFAHATIANTSDYPSGPVQMRAKLQTKQHRPVTDAYINSALSEASQATQQAWEAYEALSNKMRAQLR